jgi:hypothetical protein
MELGWQADSAGGKVAYFLVVVAKALVTTAEKYQMTHWRSKLKRWASNS